MLVCVCVCVCVSVSVSEMVVFLLFEPVCGLGSFGLGGFLFRPKLMKRIFSEKSPVRLWKMAYKRITR